MKVVYVFFGDDYENDPDRNKCKVDFKITLKGDIMMVELRTTKTTENVIHFYFW